MSKERIAELKAKQMPSREVLKCLITNTVKEWYVFHFANTGATDRNFDKLVSMLLDSILGDTDGGSR